MKTPLLILGAGGHARVVAGIAHLNPEWNLVGVLDRSEAFLGEKVGATSIIGSFSDLHRFKESGNNYAALALGENSERQAMYIHLKTLGFNVVSLFHPTAFIESDVIIGEGTIICAGAILCHEVKVGRGCIVNTGAILDHESELADFVHVAPGCSVAGRVKIDNNAFIGIGSCVREKIFIGENVIVGAGSVVIANIPPNVVAVGSPARVRKDNRDS